VNTKLAVILNWSKVNGFLLNAKKSQAMLIVNRNSPQYLSSLFLGTEPIEWDYNALLIETLYSSSSALLLL
jgi:hypothetical protein